MENLIQYIDCSLVTFSLSKGGFLKLEYNGTTYERVSVFRCFPFSSPTDFICVRDKENNEIGVLRSLSELPTETSDLIKAQLDIRYFTPIILSIYDISEQFGFTNWDVETTKGRIRFTARNERSSFVHLTSDRIIITDIDGNRYEIAELSSMPQKEIRKVVFI